MSKSINILIASPDKVLRDALTRTLHCEPLFRVIAVCSDFNSAIVMTDNASPDIVIIDSSINQGGALRATEKITTCSPAAVIAMTGMAEPVFAAKVFAAGARGLLSSRSSNIEIICAVEEVLRDNIYCTINIKSVATPARFNPAGHVAKENALSKFNQPVRAHWHAILDHVN